MFKNERIGFKDEKGYNICEGDTVRFNILAKNSPTSKCNVGSE